jgi:hypothetical protein
MKVLAIIALATLASGCHSLDHYVQPYGSDAFLIDDAEGVPLANKWCARSSKVMQPVGQNGGWNERNEFTFQCVAPADLRVSDVRPRS